jgi:hypothetical protein
MLANSQEQIKLICSPTTWLESTLLSKETDDEHMVEPGLAGPAHLGPASSRGLSCSPAGITDPTRR